MKKLSFIIFLILSASCVNREQQYKDNVTQFVHKTGRQNAKHLMTIIGSKEGYGNSEYFNYNKQRELADSMKFIDSLYLVLSNPPKGYEDAYKTIQKIYRDVKNGEQIISVVFKSSNEYNNSQYSSNLVKVSEYITNFDVFKRDLEVEYPQILIDNFKN